MIVLVRTEFVNVDTDPALLCGKRRAFEMNTNIDRRKRNHFASREFGKDDVADKDILDLPRDPIDANIADANRRLRVEYRHLARECSLIANRRSVLNATNDVR